MVSTDANHTNVPGSGPPKWTLCSLRVWFFSSFLLKTCTALWMWCVLCNESIDGSDHEVRWNQSKIYGFSFCVFLSVFLSHFIQQSTYTADNYWQQEKLTFSRHVGWSGPLLHLKCALACRKKGWTRERSKQRSVILLLPQVAVKVKLVLECKSQMKGWSRFEKEGKDTRWQRKEIWKVFVC